MSRAPRDSKIALLSKDLVIRTVWVGAFLAAGIMWLFFYERSHGATDAQARTAAVAILVVGELFYLFNCRSLNKSMFALGVFSNRWLVGGVLIMIALQLAFTYLPFMNKAFHSAPISWDTWSRILLISLTLYIVVEIEKRFFPGQKK